MNEPQPDSQPSKDRWRRVLPCVAVAAVVFLWFVPTIPFAFVNWDDPIYVRFNPYIRSLAWENVVGAFRDPYFANYHPLTIVSYAVDYCHAGLDPGPYRVQNLLWHAASASLLAALLMRFGAARSVAAILAIAWGIHPLRNESVIWISERKDVLCVFFFLAAMLFHATSPIRAGAYTRRFPFVLAAFALALLSKSMAVTLPAVLVLHDVLFRRDALRARLPIYVFLFALSALFAWLNVQAQTVAIVKDDGYTLLVRIARACHSVAYYPWKTLAPVGLAPMHPAPFGPQPFDARHFAGIAATVVALAIAARTWKRHPSAAFGVLFYLGTLFPVSGIVAFGGAYVADRYSYLPMIGLSLAAVPLLSRCSPRAAIGGAALLLLPTLLARPHEQFSWWRDTDALWQRVVDCYPKFDEARYSLAAEALDRGDHARAEAILREATTGRDELGAATRIKARLAEKRAGVSAATNALPEQGTQRIETLRLRFQLVADGTQRDSAQAALTQLLAHPECDSADIGTVANYWLRIGERRKAQELLAEAKLPSLPTAQAAAQVANLAIAEGDLDAAERWLAHARHVDPAHFDVARAAVLLPMRRGDEPEAQRVALKLLARPDVEPKTTAMLEGILGYFDLKAGRAREAFGRFQHAFENGSEDPILLRNLLGVAEALGEREWAARAGERLARVGG